MIKLVNLLKEGKVTPIVYYTTALPVLDTLLANKDVQRVISSAANSAQYGLSWKAQEPYDDVSFNPKNLKKVDPEVAGKIIREAVRVVLDEWQDDSNDTTAKQMMDFAPLFVEMSKSIPGINPTQKKAYRGTRINENKLRKFIGTTKRNDDWAVQLIGGELYVAYVGPKKNAFVYKPNREVQSWSVSEKSASRFGNVIVSTDLDDTFFFNPSFLHGITGAFKFEKETVHFGKYPMRVDLLISKDYWLEMADSVFNKTKKYSTAIDDSYNAEDIHESDQGDDEGTLDLPF